MYGQHGSFNPDFFYSFFARFFFNVSFKLSNPKVPATKEDSKIISLALLIVVSLSKASNVMKMDIVNPIPPKSPTPKIAFQFKSFGSLQNPNFTAKNEKTKIPIGLPTMSPRAMPKL